MNPLTTFVRSLGNDGALANARAVLDAAAEEDWLVQGLSRRLEQRPAALVKAPAVGTSAVA